MNEPALHHVHCPDAADGHRMAWWQWGDPQAPHLLVCVHGLSRQGMTRALLEAVRTAPDLRSQGIGAALMAEVETRARAAGAQILQLTTDKTRLRAHAFYDRLGYAPTHLGYKKTL